jgi:hypothetical protein
VKNPFKRVLSGDALLFKQYGLDKSERATMIAMGLALSQIAIPIGSAIYFIFTQTRLLWTYPKGHFTFINYYLADLWDRAPIHIDNWLHHPYFTSLHTTAAPTWWVSDRHDLRHVLIGFVAVMLIGALTVGLKKRKRASALYMLGSFPLGLLLALITAVVLIFAVNRAGIASWGVNSGNLYVQDFLASVPITVIGVLAGLAAKTVLKRTFDTIQLISLEKNLTQARAKVRDEDSSASKVELPRYAKWVYPPTYRKRFDYLVACNHVSKPHGPAMGFAMTMGAPILTFLLAFGVWVNYFGPAAK